LVAASQSATKEDVVWCYQHLLGRNPESDEVVERHAAREVDFRTVVLNFVNSAEFRQKSLVAALPLLDGRAPLSIELTAAPDQLVALRQRMARTWTALGAKPPHHSMLTGSNFFPQNLGEPAIERFYTGGGAEGRLIRSVLDRHGFGDTLSKTCVEFGCGLGRVSLALSRMFESVVGYDTSAAHIKLAEERKITQKFENVEFVLLTDIDQELISCDFLYSRLMLQHNPPPLMRYLIGSMLGSLRHGGVAIFQMPTYAPNYSFKVAEELAREWQPRIELHCMPQPEVFKAINAAGCEVLEVREDRAIGKPGWVSNTFVVERRPRVPPQLHREKNGKSAD
jgi:SAM-dependent methyltransferase